MKRLLLLISGALATGAVLLAGFGPASGADHGDAPLAKANHAEDLADVYAFDGSSTSSVVFVMTVNPLTMPGDAPSFDQGGLYQFRIDNNGDAVPDVTYNVTFGAPASGGAQTISVKKATGGAADAFSDGGAQVITGTTTVGAANPSVATSGAVKLFAGLRDDPFFFDLNAFKAGLAFRNPGNNFFKGLNVSAIVLEVRASDFLASGKTAAGVWAVTSKGGSVIDRMGRPAINTVFIPSAQKDAFNNTKPGNDVATWKSTVVSALNGLKSDPALADALLPDILTFDTAKPFGFLNGRKLTDDVIDAELQLVTANPAASDNVANDSTFSGSFPFVGAPNTAAAPTPVPAATATAAAGGAGQAAASATPATGITAPNTGSGGTAEDSRTSWWIIAGLAAAAAVLAGGAIVVRNRG